MANGKTLLPVDVLMFIISFVTMQSMLPATKPEGKDNFPFTFLLS